MGQKAEIIPKFHFVLMGELPQLNCNKEVRKSRGRGALTVIDNGRDRVLKYHKSDKYAFYTVTKVNFFPVKKVLNIPQ